MQYTFSSFVAAPRSRAALEAAMAVVEQPGRVHNPLCLFGRSGVGKSHLLHAIAQAMQVAITAVSPREVAQAHFRQSVLQKDALLIDDVDGLPPATKESVLLIIEDVVRRGTQVVVTAQTPIGAFASCIEVGEPDRTARAELARRAAAQCALPLPDAAIELIAERIRGTAPQIASVIARLALEAEVARRRVELPDVERVVARAV